MIDDDINGKLLKSLNFIESLNIPRPGKNDKITFKLDLFS